LKTTKNRPFWLIERGSDQTARGIIFKLAVKANDRVEVQPFLEKEGRFSFVSSDPKATSLACFAHLADKE